MKVFRKLFYIIKKYCVSIKRYQTVKQARFSYIELLKTQNFFQ